MRQFSNEFNLSVELEVRAIGPHTIQKPPGDDDHHHLASIHVDKHVKLGANMKRKEKKEYVTERSRTFKEERDSICTVVKVMISVFLLQQTQQDNISPLHLPSQEFEQFTNFHKLSPTHHV